MGKPSKTDNFDKLIANLQSIKRYHKQVSDVKKYYGLAQGILNAFRKPSASSVYNATLGVVEEIATKNPMGKLIFSWHGPHLKVLGAALKSNDKFEQLRKSVTSFSKSLVKLNSLKNKYTKDFKYDLQLHGQGIMSYIFLHHELFDNTEKWLVEEHLQAMNEHVTNIVKSMDYFLWYYVRIKPNFKRLKDVLNEARRNPSNNFDVIFGASTYRDFQLLIEFKVRVSNYGSGVPDLIKTRNAWANWLNKPAMSQGQYLTSSITAFGGKVATKKIKKNPTVFQWLKELVD